MSMAVPTRVTSTAIAASNPSFEDLPNEILTVILLHITSPEDLTSLTHASPISRRLFYANRLPILSQILTHAIPQENLRDAMAACGADSLNDKISQRPHLRLFWHNQAQDFFNFWHQSAFRYGEEPVTGNTDRLIALAQAVEPYIFDYAREALKRVASFRRILNIPTTHRLPMHPSELTRSERARFQRAFFRFEICRKLWQNTTPTCRNRDGYSFMFHLTVVEKEELQGVYDYLIRRAEKGLGGLERYLSSLVSQRRIAKARLSTKNSGGVRGSGNGNDELPFVQMGLYDPRHCEPSMRGSVFAQILVSQGLPFFTRFIRLSEWQQIAFLTSAPFRHLHRTFHRLFMWTPLDIPLAHFQGLLDDYFQPDEEEAAREALWTSFHSVEFSMWSHDYNLRAIPLLTTAKERYSLRALGYVFFDGKTLSPEVVLHRNRLGHRRAIAQLFHFTRHRYWRLRPSWLEHIWRQRQLEVVVDGLARTFNPIGEEDEEILEYEEY